jgi:phospholipid/cholesterol/gamma-HCH transport system ATP-binding protein
MTGAMSSAAPILEAPGLARLGAGAGAAAQRGLTVRPGELHLVFSPAPAQSAAIADALLGLSEAGEVRFRGAAWSDLAADETHRRRGEIGRLLSRGNWLDNRSVLDNLLLPLRHHTVLPDHVLRAMASELALNFGLPGIPTLLPHECTPADLGRAACIRAFLGRPQLVVLEHPLEANDTEPLPSLIAAVQQVRRRHGAVMWFTRNRAVLAARGIAADRRYRLAGSRLLELEAAA